MLTTLKWSRQIFTTVMCSLCLTLPTCIFSNPGFTKQAKNRVVSIHPDTVCGQKVTAAINLAQCLNYYFSSANKNNLTTVVLSPGTFNLLDPIFLFRVKNLTIRGAGNSTILRVPSARFDRLKSQWGEDQGRLFTIIDSSNIRLSSFVIDGSSDISPDRWQFRAIGICASNIGAVNDIQIDGIKMHNLLGDFLLIGRGLSESNHTKKIWLSDGMAPRSFPLQSQLRKAVVASRLRGKNMLQCAGPIHQITVRNNVLQMAGVAFYIAPGLVPFSDPYDVSPQKLFSTSVNLCSRWSKMEFSNNTVSVADEVLKSEQEADAYQHSFIKTQCTQRLKIGNNSFDGSSKWHKVFNQGAMLNFGHYTKTVYIADNHITLSNNYFDPGRGLTIFDAFSTHLNLGIGKVKILPIGMNSITGPASDISITKNVFNNAKIRFFNCGRTSYLKSLSSAYYGLAGYPGNGKFKIYNNTFMPDSSPRIEYVSTGKMPELSDLSEFQCRNTAGYILNHQ